MTPASPSRPRSLAPLAGRLPVVVVPDDVDIARELLSEAERIVDEYDGLDESFVSDLESEMLRDRGPTVSQPYLAATLAVVGLLGTLLVAGWEYYRLPTLQRPLHHLHDLLRPSGVLGLPCGIAGTLLMVASLVYLVRKQFPRLVKRGTLADWLSFHVFTGIVGPVLVLFHAAFVPYSALGVLALSAVAVVLASGALGRFVLALFPRTLEGRELGMDTVRERLAVYRHKLLDFGVPPSFMDLDAPPRRRRAPPFLLAVVRVIAGDRERKRELSRLLASVRARPELRRRAGDVIPLVQRFCRERQWLVRYQELRRLMGMWRFFHRWFAIILFGTVVYHVVVTARFGGLWILGGH